MQKLLKHLNVNIKLNNKIKIIQKYLDDLEKYNSQMLNQLF